MVPPLLEVQYQPAPCIATHSELVLHALPLHSSGGGGEGGGAGGGGEGGGGALSASGGGGDGGGQLCCIACCSTSSSNSAAQLVRLFWPAPQPTQKSAEGDDTDAASSGLQSAAAHQPHPSANTSTPAPLIDAVAAASSPDAKYASPASHAIAFLRPPLVPSSVKPISGCRSSGREA